MTSSVGTLGLAALLAAAFAAAPASAKIGASAHCEAEGPLPMTPLPETDTPLRVTIGLFLVDVTEISDPNQTFAADFTLSVSWRDPRLADLASAETGACYFRPDEIWYPSLAILNRRTLATDWSDVIEIDSEGVALYRQRFEATLTALGEFSHFPFDARDLRVSVVLADRPAETASLEAALERSGRSRTFSVPNWRIRGFETERSRFQAIGERGLAQLDFVVRAERKPRYYIWNAVIPLLLIVFMSWSVFFVNPAHLEAQLAVAATSMLTLVTYRFSLRSILPPISYLTRFDIFLTGGTVLVFLALAEAVLTSALADQDKAELALRIDRWARLLFPSATVLLIASSFAWT